MEPIEGAEHLQWLGPAENLYEMAKLPFTPAIRVPAGADLVFTAGVLGPATTDDPDQSVEAEFRRVYENLAEVLRLSGASMSDVVSITKYVKDIERDNPLIAEATFAAFPHLVTSTTIEIGRFVPPGLHLEVSAIAAVRHKSDA